MVNENNSMTYKEAVKYLKNINLSPIEADALTFSGYNDIEGLYIKASAIVNEYQIQKFLNMKFKRPI